MTEASSKDELIIVMAGVAIPQGSMKGYMRKGKDNKQHVRITHSNKKDLDPWREAVGAAVGREVLNTVGWYSDNKDIGYVVHVIFNFPKPTSAPKKRRLNTRRPDVDKLVRSILDALTEVAFPDDAQCVEVMGRKNYCPPDTPPHVLIRVRKEYP